MNRDPIYRKIQYNTVRLWIPFFSKAAVKQQFQKNKFSRTIAFAIL